MERDQLIRILSQQGQEFERLGVKSLALFGSVGRGESRPESDVDILVEFEGKATFDRYMELKFFLEDLLGRDVDLVLADTLKDQIRPKIAKEVRYVQGI